MNFKISLLEYDFYFLFYLLYSPFYSTVLNILTLLKLIHICILKN